MDKIKKTYYGMIQKELKPGVYSESGVRQSGFSTSTSGGKKRTKKKARKKRRRKRSKKRRK